MGGWVGGWRQDAVGQLWAGSRHWAATPQWPLPYSFALPPAPSGLLVQDSTDVYSAEQMRRFDALVDVAASLSQSPSPATSGQL